MITKNTHTHSSRKELLKGKKKIYGGRITYIFNKAKLSDIKLGGLATTKFLNFLSFKVKKVMFFAKRNIVFSYLCFYYLFSFVCYNVLVFYDFAFFSSLFLCFPPYSNPFFCLKIHFFYTSNPFFCLNL